MTYLTSAFTNPFLSSLENCNRYLEPFFRETSRFKVFDMRDRELVQHYDVYA